MIHIWNNYSVWSHPPHSLEIGFFPTNHRINYLNNRIGLFVVVLKKFYDNICPWIWRSAWHIHFEEDLFMTAIADERAAVNKNPWIWYWGWWECNTCHIIYVYNFLSFFIIMYVFLLRPWKSNNMRNRLSFCDNIPSG